MKKSWKVIAICGIAISLLFIMFASAYIKSVGFQNLKLMYTVRTTDAIIVKMEEEGKYLAVQDSYNVAVLKERMHDKGWNFVEQEGSGYFFESEGERIVITMKQWKHSYIIFSVQENAVDIADRDM